MKLMARTKRYKAEDGTYLGIKDGYSDRYYIAWYIPEDADFGGVMGECETTKPDNPKDKSEWETWQTERTIKPLSDGKDDAGFFFNTIKKARMALAAANNALFTGEPPWPAWAVQAKEAGWTPPKGWKP